MVEVAGSSSSYTLQRKARSTAERVLACRNQELPIADRVCKHLLAYLLDRSDQCAAEDRREAVESFPKVFDG